MGGWIANPAKDAWGIGIGKPTKESGRVFLETPSVSGVAEGKDEEDVIAENIFDWWVSGKSYNKWYSEKFLQQKIDFGAEQ